MLSVCHISNISTTLFTGNHSYKIQILLFSCPLRKMTVAGLVLPVVFCVNSMNLNYPLKKHKSCTITQTNCSSQLMEFGWFGERDIWRIQYNDGFVSEKAD